MAGPTLLEDEEVLMELRPHPLAFLRHISICLYYVVMGACFSYLISRLMSAWPAGMPSSMEALVILAVWWGLVLAIPLVLYILDISSWPLVLSVLLCAAGSFLALRCGVGPGALGALAIAGGLIGLFLTDAYRRGHKYYITDQRILMVKEFFTRDERSLRYEAITDVVVHKGLLGRLLGFGDVIPVASSGLSHPPGESGEPGAADRALGLPRAGAFMRLLGVPRPEEVGNLINKVRAEWSGRPYLMRIARATEELLRLAEEKTGPGDQVLP